MKINEMSIKKRRVMIYFIEAARQVLISDGIEGLSIRRIADIAGYNSATLYNYFDDLNHLMLYASMSYLRDYVLALSHRITPAMNALECYRTVYETFDSYAFKSPEIFYNMFFGPRHARLSEVAEQYYEFFPEELAKQTAAVRKMLTQGNMYLRDYPMVEELVKEGFIKAENAEQLAVIVPRLNQTYLHEFIQTKNENNVNPEEFHGRFMEAFDYLLKTARQTA